MNDSTPNPPAPREGKHCGDCDPSFSCWSDIGFCRKLSNPPAPAAHPPAGETEVTQEPIALAFAALGGREWRQDQCMCDPDVGACPCQYCAIHRGLTYAATFATAVERDRLKEELADTERSRMSLAHRWNIAETALEAATSRVQVLEKALEEAEASILASYGEPTEHLRQYHAAEPPNEFSNRAIDRAWDTLDLIRAALSASRTELKKEGV